MKNYKNKTLGDTVSTIGSMLLFLLFAGCLLIMIAVAAGAYSRISNGFDKTFGATASLRYISNKIKSSDIAEISENGTALYLKSDDILDVIYFRDGALYESNFAADAEPSTEGGSKLFTLEDMNISEDGDLYKVTVKFNDEQNYTYIRR